MLTYAEPIRHLSEKTRCRKWLPSDWRQFPIIQKRTFSRKPERMAER